MAAKIVTIAQQKGGAGKTTLAAQLSVAFAIDGAQVALIDIDPQRSASAWHAMREERADDTPITLSTVSGWKLDGEIARLKGGHDLVVIDSPPHAETEAKAAIRSADLVLAPIQPSPMDLWAIEPTLALAERQAAALLLVLNRVPARSRLADQLRSTLAARALPVADATLGNRQAFAASMMAGAGVVESHRRSSAATEIRALVTEIRTRLG